MRTYYFIILLLALSFVACNDADKTSASAADSLKTAQTEISPKEVTATDLPANVRFRGTLHKAIQWQDKKGDNLLITSLVAPYNSGEEEERTAELHAFHFVKNKSGDYKLLWQMTDTEQECPVDITCSFLDQGITITDLDSNGIAETTIVYKKACRGDPSPATLKVVMHQDTAKYALRGLTWNDYDRDENKDALLPATEKDVNLATLPGYKGTEKEYAKTYGRYENEKDFQNAPPAFMLHARRQWLKLSHETYD
ncbi:hypothetical protein JMG10_27400 [Nostoc ellipsosporum NOK]|nr:hypothetical protein [Nostoc ellipsosporum NOK]